MSNFKPRRPGYESLYILGSITQDPHTCSQKESTELCKTLKCVDNVANIEQDTAI